MYQFLLTVSVILSVVLVIIILMQASKGSGLAGSIGGGGQLGNVFGTRRTADFLSRATWWLGGTVIILAIAINLFFLPGKATQAERDSIIQSGQQQQIPTGSSLPAPTDAGTETAVPGDGAAGTGDQQ